MGDRAVSATLAYVLSLAIIVMVMSGLFFAGADFVEGQTDRVIRSELRVIGHQIAADISNVDQLTIVEERDSTVQLSTHLPRKTAGKSYTITIAASGTDRYDINLSTRQPDVTRTVSVKTNATVVETTIVGGDIDIAYNGTHIEVEHA